MKMEQIISRVPIHNSLHNVRLFPSVCKNINTFNVNILKSTMYTHRKKKSQKLLVKSETSKNYSSLSHLNLVIPTER